MLVRQLKGNEKTSIENTVEIPTTIIALRDHIQKEINSRIPNYYKIELNTEDIHIEFYERTNITNWKNTYVVKVFNNKQHGIYGFVNELPK